LEALNFVWLGPACFETEDNRDENLGYRTRQMEIYAPCPDACITENVLERLGLTQPHPSGPRGSNSTENGL
jgi:hypothetical protein